MKHRLRYMISLLVWLMASPMLQASSIDTVGWIARLDSVEYLINWGYEQEYRAIRLAKQSMKLKRMYYGEDSEQYLLSLLRISELYSQRGITSQTNRYHRMAYDPYMAKLRADFCTLSENQKAIYWQTASAYFNKTMSVAYNQSRSSRVDDGSPMAAAAYNAQLLSKGLLLNLSIDIERYVKASGNSRANALLTERKQIMTRGNAKAVDKLDLQILQALRDSGQAYHIDQLALTWQQVQERLDDNDLAIEFFRTQSDQYGALLLKSKWKWPKLIPVPKDSMVWSNRLLQYFPRPGEGTIYFSADGSFLQMAIEQLPFVDDVVLSDVYDMVRLSSTRELALNRGEDIHQSAVIYGGIGYTMNAEELAEQSQRYDTVPMKIWRTVPKERGSVVQWLPGTLVEADTIYQILTNNAVEADLYTRYAANEESFKALNQQHQGIMHIATHGFMWAGDSDPMSRCGLLMAGANLALSGHADQLPAGVQDGILTAQEISVLDFNDCNIAVLSACETAKGDVTSEGVFGLQRAFKMAGVQTIVMSLWPVDDGATQMLMTTFYRNWIEKKMPKREAFKQAQNTVRYAVDKDGDYMYNNPIYWAGFIMMD